MTTHAIKEQSSYRSYFDEDLATAKDRVPSWLRSLREQAFERFEESGFPTTDQEDWKYTNVSAIARADFKPASGAIASTAVAAQFDAFFIPEAARSRMVFVDGFYREDLSQLDALAQKAVVLDLAEACSGEFADVVRDHLSKNGDPGDAFVNLNTSFAGSGALIVIPENVHCEAPIHVLFISTREGAATFPRVLVISERGSKATLIESFLAVESPEYFSNSVSEVFVADGAILKHYKVQRESEHAFHVASTTADLGRDSSYDLTTITLGAKLSRHNILVRMDHEGTECWVDGLYAVGTGQHTDTHSLIDHRRPRCTSHQNYKGILDGKSRAVFNGRVYVHRDAQQTDAMQSNKNLLLSPDARVDTKPQLEIYADDVKCAHGATVGQLEEEELFYLVSRGLHTELAQNLLTYGFAEEIVAKIGIESIRAQLDEAILNRLHARLEA